MQNRRSAAIANNNHKGEKNRYQPDATREQAERASGHDAIRAPVRWNHTTINVNTWRCVMREAAAGNGGEKPEESRRKTRLQEISSKLDTRQLPSRDQFKA